MKRRRPSPFAYMRPYWAVPGGGFWREAEKYAQEVVVVKHKHDLVSPPVEPARLLKMRVKLGYGTVYYMTIRIAGEDGFSRDYDVTVNRLPACLPWQIVSFAQLPASERKTESSVLNKAQSSSIIPGSCKTSDGEASNSASGKKIASDTTMSDDIEDTNVSVSALRTRGFYILLNHIRTEKPYLSYAKAKKTASSTWGKLPEDEKMKFVDAAAKRLEP